MPTSLRRILTACAVCLTIVSVAGCSKDPNVEKQEILARGNALFDEGKFREAVVEYRNAIKVDEQFGEARYKLAESFAKLGDLRSAYREYVRAADLLPENAEAQVKAGTLLLLGGQYEDAKSRAQKAIALNPKGCRCADPAAPTPPRACKDLEGAVREIEDAIKLDPRAGTRLREPRRAAARSRQSRRGRDRASRRPSRSSRSRCRRTSRSRTSTGRAAVRPMPRPR